MTTTNWIEEVDPGCHYAWARQVPACTSPESQMFGPVFKLWLPGSPSLQPNVEILNVHAFALICDTINEALCVSPYLDAPPGSIKFHNEQGDIPQGWTVADGGQYGGNNRYDPTEVATNFVEKFARGTEHPSNPDSKLWQTTRGRAVLCRNDIGHHHIFNSPQDNYSPEDAPGLPVTIDGVCLYDNMSFNDYQRDGVHLPQSPGGFLLGIDYETPPNEAYPDEPTCPGNGTPVKFPPGAGCEDGYGEINVMNPHQYLMPIERTRNYQEGAGIHA